MSEDLPDVSAPAGIVPVPTERGLYRRYFKRLFDILAVLFASPVVVPAVALLAIVVMLGGARPFYSSDRVGRGGRTFRMIKLRTMVADADKRLEGYLERDANARQEWDATQKLKKDPRVTALGRFLRKTSIDELPQLWNVLMGDMSLVGPRPMMPEQRAIYPNKAYYMLRPGVTGLWQISDRNNCTFARRAEFDAEYEQSVSFTGDLMIMVKTVTAVTKGTGY